MKQKSNGKKVKNLVSFLLLLFSIFTANAQQLVTVKGVVTDGEEPLPNVTVKAKNSTQWTVTKNNGSYELKLPKGEYTLVFKTLEREKTKRISLTKNTTLNVDFYHQYVNLNEVLVSAVRVKADAPVTHSNVTKKEISKRNLGQDIPILLNYLPSVITSSDAGAGVGYTYMRVRGSDASRINVTINGIPYNDAESQGTFWVNISDFSSSVENLQLQRGVGTSTNGAGAFGASLNILTDAPSEKAYVEIANSLGSYATEKHNVKFSTGKLNNHFEFSGRISKIYSDGYVDRAFSDLQSYFLQGVYNDRKRQIKALVFGGKEKTYQAWYGLDAEQLKENRRQNPYTYENETDNYWQDHFQLHWTERINNNWSLVIGTNYTNGKGYYEQYKTYKEDKPQNILLTEGSDAIVRRWLDNDLYVINAHLNYKNNKLEIISGASYSDYENDHFGQLIWGQQLAPNVKIRDHYYDSKTTKNDISIFSKITYKLNVNLLTYIDLQGRFIDYERKGLTSDRASININKSYRFFNPKAGVTYLINPNNNLYFSYARGNREPNGSDFENGVTTHESLNDFELGWRYASEKAKINTNLYYMQYQNQLVLTGAIDDVGAPIRATSGKSYRLGLEVDADISVSNQISIKPNIALSSHKNIDFTAKINGELTNLGNTNISFSPNIIIGNALIYQPAKRLSFAFLSKYVGEQYMGNIDSKVSNNAKLDAYFVSDLNAVYTIKPTKIVESVTFSVLINNLFNKKYVDRGYYGTYDDNWSNPNKITTLDYAGYYPQATTNFLAGITLKF